MKKRIIIIPLILFATSSLYAQEKVIYNSDGTVGPAKIQVTHNGISTPVNASQVNSEGIPKSNHPSTQVNYDKVTIVNIAEVNDDGTPIGYKQTAQLSKPQVVKVEVDDNDLSYRSNGNATKRDLIGKNEDAPRNTNPRDLIGKNENEPRKMNAQMTNNQSIGTTQPMTTKASNVQTSAPPQGNSNHFVIPESDKNLSDAELNKKYPARNGNYVKLATGDNHGVSDQEKQKSYKPSATPQTNKNTQKNELRGDELKAKK